MVISRLLTQGVGPIEIVHIKNGGAVGNEQAPTPRGPGRIATSDEQSIHWAKSLMMCAARSSVIISRRVSPSPSTPPNGHGQQDRER